VSECDREASIMRRPWSTKGCCFMKRKIKKKINYVNATKALHFTSVSGMRALYSEITKTA